MRTLLTRLLATTVVAAVATLGLLTPPTAAASTKMTATTAVNVRSAPSTSAKIVGDLYRGQTVTATAEAKGWTTITYKGKPAYVSSAYLVKGTSLPPGNQVGKGTVRTTTTAVNLRRGPSLSDAVITVLKQGTRVTSTGKTAKGWTEVVAGKLKGWVSSQYLTASSSGLPAITGIRVATADLDVRTSSADNAKIVGMIIKGAKVSITGATANGRAQIIYAGAVRWVTAKYLSNASTTQPEAPRLPPITGVRYATANLTIRSDSSDKYTALGEIPRGTKISITGVVKNARMQIVWNGAVRWVTAKYLSTTKPGTGGSSGLEKGLKPNAVKVLRAVQQNFPEITRIGGVRPDPLPDHPSGRALDLMVPNYKSASGKALGTRLSRYLQTNNKSLGVNYVIYDQHIWNVTRDDEGWRYMAPRGSDSANHKDHVHVTVFASGLPPI